jgi:pimeloyl-ACP methyl ester carboxylesterase
MKLIKLKVIFLIVIAALMAITTSAQEQATVLKTPSGDINGVLLKPVSKKKIPVVLIISGSGPTDKDGNQAAMLNNSLKMLAEALKQNGIASLRFDKRGIAGSRTAGKQESDLRFDNFIDDVSGWINLLAQDKKFSKIIVAGHSEGSLIGMIASAKDNRVKKYVSIAGAGKPAAEILKEQLSSRPQAVKDLVFPMLDTLKRGETIPDVPASLNVLFRPSIQPYLISWFKYNPQTEIKKLKIPSLIIQGDKDIQVSVKDADSLAAAAGNKASEKIIVNMNHVLKNIEITDQTEQLKIYSNPNLPINTEMVKEIVKFIQR